MLIRKLLMGMLLASLWVAAPMVSAQTQTPAATVKGVVDEVISLLADTSLEAKQRREQLRAVLSPNFDFVTMSRSVLAANWKKATAEEQKRFVELFQRLLGDVYITAMEEYAGQTVRIGKERVEGERASVETFIVRGDGSEIPVHYRMRVGDQRWLAYDVSVEGVSLVNTYRGTFGSIIRKNKMSGLLDQLSKKVSPQN